MLNPSQTINKLVRKNYFLTKLLYELKFRRNSIGSHPIIILQMGKVGSTSILHSLQATSLFSDVLQVHTLSNSGIREMEKRYWGHTPVLLRKSLLPETTHVFISHSLMSLLRRTPNGHWKIITLVRDPIARNVSEFFYSVDTTKSDPHLPDFYTRYRSGDLKTSDLIDRFLERFSESSREYEVPLNWFDVEFRDALGVDIFSSEFPVSKGYQIINTSDFEILILKLESLRECYRSAFREFLGLHNLILNTANAASQKDYSAAYNSFIREVRLPYSYVSKVYQSKLVRHFYHDQEIDQFVIKWHKG